MNFPFEVILIFSYISTFLLIGTLLRAFLKLLQKFFVPASIIGGLMGLLFYELFDILFSIKEIFPKLYLEAFAYHFFNLSFISIGLTPNEDRNIKNHSFLYKGSLWMALSQGITFPLQAVIGALFISFFLVLGIDIHPMFGFLFPLGFNEGPGQALSIGKVWEAYGFKEATTIGLAFATIGYLFSIFVGVPLSQYFIRKGYIENTKEITEEFLKGYFSPNKYQIEKNQSTFHQNHIEPLAFQCSLVGFVYLLTYGLISFMSFILPEDYQKVMWGFFFIFGLLIALILRKILKIFKKEYFIQMNLQRKITAFTVDYLIVSTIISIKIVAFAKFFLPVLLISFVGGFTTLLILVVTGKKFIQYGYERILAIFGTVTGTTSTGLLLLRMVDPEFKTPVSKELALMNIFSIPIIGSLTFLLNGYFLWKFSLFEMLIGYLIIGCLFLFIVLSVKKLYQ